jgi:predicted enzyme related to lactoylglutathione lyase
MIETIDNVSIVVDDLKSAVKWYSEVLGLKHKFTEESIQWAEMDAGGRSTLALKTSGRPQICLVVTEMDGEMERLSALGVKFTEIFDLPGGLGRGTSFDDPWGNEIGFYEAPKK